MFVTALLFWVLFDSACLDSLGAMVGPSPGAWATGPGLSEVARAAATRDGLGDLYLFAVLFDQVADVDHALEAGARTLYGGWVRGVR